MNLTRTVSTFLRFGERIIKTKWGKGIVETSKSANPFGFDGNPPRNLIAVLGETLNNEDSVILGYINVKSSESLNIGDSIQYSTDLNGEIKSFMICRINGTMEMLGTGDFMVRYSKLEEAYNQLKSDHDDLVSAFNQHMHATAASGPPSIPMPIPTVIPASQSTGNITGARINEIETIE